jgi:hypothetical protein
MLSVDMPLARGGKMGADARQHVRTEEAPHIPLLPNTKSDDSIIPSLAYSGTMLGNRRGSKRRRGKKWYYVPEFQGFVAQAEQVTRRRLHPLALGRPRKEEK